MMSWLVVRRRRDFRKDFHAFRKMGSQKPKLVRRFLLERRWAAVVLSDTDTVWLRNPQPYLALHPSADVYISTDCLSHQVRADPLPALQSGVRHGSTAMSAAAQ